MDVVPQPQPDDTSFPERTTFTVRILPDDVPRAARMKQWLKIGLRRFGIRCESMADPAPPASEGTR